MGDIKLILKENVDGSVEEPPMIPSMLKIGDDEFEIKYLHQDEETKFYIVGIIIPVTGLEWELPLGQGEDNGN